MNQSEELLRHNAISRILDRNRLIARVAILRKQGAKIVLATGCFDLLHIGHIRYLEGAKLLGDVLIAGINCDSQVSVLKGENRPFIPERERAEIIASLRAVDYVTIFSEPTVAELIRTIRPDFYAKGSNYTVDTVPERDVVRSVGGRVAIIGDPKNYSTMEMSSQALQLDSFDMTKS